MNRKTALELHKKSKCKESKKQKSLVHVKKGIALTEPCHTKQNLLQFQIYVPGTTKPIVVSSESQIAMKNLKQTLLRAVKKADLAHPRKIIGLQTLSGQYTVDYKLQEEIGTLSSGKKFRLLYQSSETGLNSYKVCRCLATGGFSKVYLVRSLKTGRFFAGKFMDKSRMQTFEKQELIIGQIAVNRQLDHFCLVKMHEMIETQNFHVLIMDYCPGGELFYLLRKKRRFTEDEVKFFIIQILLGIQYLHDKKLVYRDLKPQNILIDQTGHLKIADFGLAKECPERKRLHSYCGSIEYMAPEIINNEGHSFGVDYYCVGALMFELLVGCPPFYNPDFTEQETKYSIMHSQVMFPPDLNFTYEIKDLICRLLEKDARIRIGSLGGVRQIFFHPWFGRINKEIYQKKLVRVPYIPNLDVINFDDDQIGVSEDRFTQKVVNQMKKPVILMKNKSCSLNKRNSFQQSSAKKFGISPYQRLDRRSLIKSNDRRTKTQETMGNFILDIKDKSAIKAFLKSYKNTAPKATMNPSAFLKDKDGLNSSKYSQSKLKKLYKTIKLTSGDDTSKVRGSYIYS